MTVVGAGPSLDELLASLETMPVSRAPALAVVRIASDPGVGTTELSQACAADPVLAAQLLRVANSAAYGLSTQVTTIKRAVVVLGISSVRSIAAAAAATSALQGGPRPDPSFWVTAATTATAAAQLASRVGASRDEAFCVGVLHELGAALFQRVDPQGWPSLVAECTGRGEGTISAERERYGVDHAWAAARVLHAWDFPSSLCDAVARHHEPASSSLLSPLPAALLAGRALAAMVPGTTSHDPSLTGPAGRDALLVAGIDEHEAVAMAERVREASTELASALVT